MKLKKGDKVMVISGRDKGKKGEISVVLPKTNQVVIEGINTVKKHTKPSAKEPKGGIVSREKPILASKVMAIDSASGRVARIGYKKSDKGVKTRIFKVSNFKATKITKLATKQSKTEVKK